MSAEIIENYTQAAKVEIMSPGMLAASRSALGFGQSDLARALNMPLRTLQDYEAGKRAIPGVVAVAIGLFAERDRWNMARIGANLADRVARDFPNGILSECEPIDD